MNTTYLDQSEILAAALADKANSKPNPHIFIDPSYNAPPPDPEILKNNKFVLIRHGVTEFNLVFSDVCGKYGFEAPEYRDLKVNADFIDIELRKEGVM